MGNIGSMHGRTGKQCVHSRGFLHGQHYSRRKWPIDNKHYHIIARPHQLRGKGNGPLMLQSNALTSCYCL